VAVSDTVTDRDPELDVLRGLALIGVCIMNYHGYLVLRGATPGDGLLARVFDPWRGPLATRFAAVFVTVAGVGVVLLTHRARSSGDRAAISAVRWVLVRRGVLLFAFGWFLDWVWPGTILFFYGAYFLMAAALFTLRCRWLVLIGAMAAVAAAAVQWWSVDRMHHGHDTSWLLQGESEATKSPRDLLFDVAVRGTHPLLPWLVFLCLGMVLGRRLIDGRLHVIARTQLAFAGVLAVATGYVLRDSLPVDATLRSTFPVDRGLLYVLTTLGSTAVAIAVVGPLARRWSSSAPVRWLAVTGRTTLTLYVLHVLCFGLVVDWLEWVRPGGLTTSLLFAAVFWVVAVAAANLWSRVRPLGPLEWWYRRFSRA